MGLQHFLVREQAPGYPLRVIQTIHPHQKLHRSIPTQRLSLGLYRRIVRQGGERFGVDAHGKDAQANLPIGQLHSINFDRQAKDLSEGRREVPEVGGGVEADQVRPEEPPQELISFRQSAEKLFGRKRYMKEEADPGIG
jgi:hypothetical protein